MKRSTHASGALGIVLAIGSAAACASEAHTSASAGSRLGRDGTAAATARYEGDVGFARTSATSGPVSRARGVAVGVDQDGLSLSVSHAVAPRNGPAVAANLSITIDRDGDVALHRSRAFADGPFERSANAGGSTSSGSTGGVVLGGGGIVRSGSGPVAVGSAGGRTDPYGRVQAVSRSETSRSGLPASTGISRGRIR